jgi:hypothetical protein
MKKSDDVHWTADKDLLERFVMNRMEPAERNELEDHLRICEVCKLAVRQERQLIAGIRSAGRNDIKERLARRLEETQAHAVPWPRIASIAALLLIVVGIGLYSNWFVLRQQNQIARDEGSQVQSKTPSSHEESADQFTAAQPQARDRESATRPDVRVMARNQTEPTVKEAASPEKVSAKHPAGAVHEFARREETPGLDEVSIERADVAMRDSTESSSFWVEGTVIAELAQSAEAQGEERKLMRSKALLNAEEGKDARHMASTSQTVNGQQIMLQQRPVSELPLTRQQMQIREKKESVETKVDVVPSGLNFTLYLDQLVATDDLQRSRIEPVNEDSLVIHLPNQRIGYYIPGGWAKKQSGSKNTR